MNEIPTLKRPLSLDLSEECMGPQSKIEKISIDDCHDEEFQRILSTTKSCLDTQSIFDTLKHRNCHLGKLLGTGSSSHVYELLSPYSYKSLVIKIFKTEKLKSENTSALQEGDVLSFELSHPGIITPTEVLCSDRKEVVGLVMPLAPGRNLRELLDMRIFSTYELIQIALNLIDPILYLHDQEIIHRDLRLENVIVDDDLSVRIGDFGLAKKIFRDEYLTPVGDQTYSAPENINTFCATFNRATDAYAVGVILNKMAKKNHPLLTPVIQGLLEDDPTKRLTLKQAQEMLWKNRPT